MAIFTDPALQFRVQPRVVQHLQLGREDVTGGTTSGGGGLQPAVFQVGADQVDRCVQTRELILDVRRRDDATRDAVSVSVQHEGWADGDTR